MTDLDKLIEAVDRGDYPPVDYYPDEWVGDRRVDLMYDAFQGSLDAAKALHEALLPGYKAAVCTCGEATIEHVLLDGDCDEISGCFVDNNPARAWLIAILKAYRSQVQE